jgi:riboflavin kinase / FMN adenylyltransferase
MQVIADAWHSTDLPHGVVATIGNYDGVHRGQRVILERLVARARDLELPPVVVTFDPHPLAVLRRQEAPALLATQSQKERCLEAAGIEATLVVRFDRDLAARSAREFVEHLLVRRLGVRALFVGSGFRFGRGREGSLELLRRLGEEHGFEAHGVDEVVYRGEPISSTRIRRAITEGEVEGAAEMLGRPWELTGSVARGDRMGKRLGWPTVNIDPDHALTPLDGVYATRIGFAAMPGAVFDSVTNVGTRPTVYENYQRVVETHVLDFRSDVYGQPVALAFFRRLREERMFPSIMDLSAQIGRDVEATREFFAGRQRAARGEAVEQGTHLAGDLGYRPPER